MTLLPQIMVAPNGARRTKSDHPALPISIPEIVATAKQCANAGADGIHLHVRDDEGNHVLDAGLYLELLRELSVESPALYTQITTESVGQYSPAQQRDLVQKVMPKAVSVSLSEMFSDGETPQARSFYRWAAEAEIHVQHILYSPSEFSNLVALIRRGIIPEGNVALLFVLGRYVKNQRSTPDMLLPFLNVMKQSDIDFDWAVCAFGQAESDCLVSAMAAGGKVRVGFENSLWNQDGRLAKDNAERIHEIIGLRQKRLVKSG